jgi:hypothetical protein
MDLSERRLSIDVSKGKDSKFKAKRFFIDLDQPGIDFLGMFNRYKEFIESMYAKDFLTMDNYGKKFFITCKVDTMTWNDTRVTTSIFTKVFRDRLKLYFNKAQPNMTDEEVDEVAKSYGSHSMRRGGTSTAKLNGVAEDEVMELGGWNRKATKDGYQCTNITGENMAYKKMKLPLSKTHQISSGRALFSDPTKKIKASQPSQQLKKKQKK